MPRTNLNPVNPLHMEDIVLHYCDDSFSWLILGDVLCTKHNVYLNRCVASWPVTGWRLPLTTPDRWQTGVASATVIGTYDSCCFRCIQAITTDIIIAYITHDDHPNVLSASSWQRAKRRDGFSLKRACCLMQSTWFVHRLITVVL